MDSLTPLQKHLLGKELLSKNYSTILQEIVISCKQFKKKFISSNRRKQKILARVGSRRGHFIQVNFARLKRSSALSYVKNTRGKACAAGVQL